MKYSVQTACRASVSGLQFAGYQIPYLEQFVQVLGDDDSVAAGGCEEETRYPLGMAVILDSVFVYMQNIPKLDSFFLESRYLIVRAESLCQHMFGMSFKLSHGCAFCVMPKAFLHLLLLPGLIISEDVD